MPNMEIFEFLLVLWFWRLIALETYIRIHALFLYIQSLVDLSLWLTRTQAHQNQYKPPGSKSSYRSAYRSSTNKVLTLVGFNSKPRSYESNPFTNWTNFCWWEFSHVYCELFCPNVYCLTLKEKKFVIVIFLLLH